MAIYWHLSALNRRNLIFYIYNMTTKEVKNLTNDIFSDSEPVFSPDGKTIYFASDRGDIISSSMISKNFKFGNMILRKPIYTQLIFLQV